MKYLDFESHYDRFPKTKVNGHTAITGWDAIVSKLVNVVAGKHVVAVDTYPGVCDEEVLPQLKKLQPTLIIEMNDIFKDSKTINEQIKYQMTDDRVFGNMYYGKITDFIDADKLEKAKQTIKETEGLVLVYGFGAYLVEDYDVAIYLDMARWEIQMRMRKGMPNFKADNPDEDQLRKFKRGYFFEWRIADKHKVKYFDRIDYFIDTNKVDEPKMITKQAMDDALDAVVKTPFRTVPYFDPGVWGGQWMKEVCGLPEDAPNYAWSFDGVPEENSVLFDFAGTNLEFPAMDVVLLRPQELLGPQVFSRFGAEFPIRFDFLDTMEGQNLSLQVHPLTEYAKKQFGISYTQDESYYILDAKEDATVYLGLKEGIEPKAMVDDLRKANRGDNSFDAEAYINKFPAKKHDHYLIPAGTCHCSGTGAMVLEISATPYIFTFKLWDWDRLGMDGLPRPVHIDHGEKVIQWNRTTPWVKEHLVNAFYPVETERQDATVEHTGLHELEFIETRRYSFDQPSLHETNNTVQMLNLVEGKEALISSPDGEFEPFEVHYAETFIIPANVKKYTIAPTGRSIGDTIKVIKAYVRS